MMDWHLVLSSSAFAISVASLLVSRHAWTIAEEAKGKARHSLRVSVYSVEVNRKRLGIPYDHDVVEQYEANEGIFAAWVSVPIKAGDARIRTVSCSPTTPYRCSRTARIGLFLGQNLSLF